MVEKLFIFKTCLIVFFLSMAVTQQNATAKNIDKIIEKYVELFQPSTLSKAEQREQLQWYKDISQPFQGEQIKTAAEELPIHEFERDILAKAFE